MKPQEIRTKYSLRTYNTVCLLQFFSDTHLNPKLQEVTKPIQDAAFYLADNTCDGTELQVALRHLIDARAAAIRHYLVTHNFRLPEIVTVDISEYQDTI